MIFRLWYFLGKALQLLPLFRGIFWIFSLCFLLFQAGGMLASFPVDFALCRLLLTG